MQNKLISILIPTYNRADFLDYSLELHIPLVEKFNIQIVIFDNASTDHTKEIANKWMDEYPYLVYVRHEENIGGVGNFEYALNYPQTDYVWLLGDTYQIQDGTIDYIIRTIDSGTQKCDALILNLDDKISIPTSNYVDSNKLLNELGAVMTCIAVCVFRKDMIQEDVLIRYRSLWFTHDAIIFESISNKDFLIHWVNDHSIKGLEHSTLQKTNWSHTSKAFEIGCKDWANFVMSLPPSYTIANKMKCIMDFGKVSGLFSLQNLVMLRVANLLTFDVFSRYKKIFRFTVDYPLSLILIISVMPKWIFKSIAILAIMVLKRDKVANIKKIFNK